MSLMPRDPIVRESKRRIERGSKSFAAAAKLFPRETRHDAYMLYAWCRYCDDEVDGQDFGFRTNGAEPAACARKLAELRDKTEAALNGEAQEPVFEALARVAAKHDIPARHPLELLDGFAMDVEGRHYETIEDTLDYCYHVAGVVGVMMAMIMGVRDRPTLLRACDLGLGFQLTNIARDVIEDAEDGRVYLPAEWLDEAGVPRDKVADPAYRAQVAGVVGRMLDLADAYYRSARQGIAELPLRSAWTIAAASRIYRAIGRDVQALGSRAWDRRVSTSKARKLGSLSLGGVDALGVHTLAAIRPVQPRGALWTKPSLIESDEHA
jgi:phytoene synthase